MIRRWNFGSLYFRAARFQQGEVQSSLQPDRPAARLFGAAAVVGVPLFFVLRDTAGNSGATLGMMAVMLPMFFLAMYQKNGQPAEKILRYYLQARFIRPKVRPYQTRNYYALLMKGDDTHDSVSEKE